jgi:hypothetical protein
MVVREARTSRSRSGGRFDVERQVSPLAPNYFAKISLRTLHPKRKLKIQMRRIEITIRRAERSSNTGTIPPGARSAAESDGLNQISMGSFRFL